jgi:DoxX-like family
MNCSGLTKYSSDYFLPVSDLFASLVKRLLIIFCLQSPIYLSYSLFMKSNYSRIIYHITLLLFSIALTISGTISIAGPAQMTDRFSTLGYPSYFIVYLGICKLTGIASLWLIRIPFLKHFTYAGFFILFISAIVSHIAAGGTIADVLPAFILLQLLLTNFYCYTKMKLIKQKNREKMHLIHRKTGNNDPGFDLKDPYYDAG